MRIRAWTAATVVVALLTGCDVVKSKDDVSNPMTPEQSKTQVVDAAKELVGTLDLQVVEAFFWHSSCSDQGDAPFRGQMRIAYPPAASFEQSDAEVADMAQRLEKSGWSRDSDFKSHGTVLEKNNVVAVLGPQNVSNPNRDIQVYGECRDMTTAKGDNLTEPVTLD
jgi:predicted nuclease of predicted toxin-antitoxin system